jgi:hypothetical protein
MFLSTITCNICIDIKIELELITPRMDSFDHLFLVSGEAFGGEISPVGSIGVSSNKN